MTRVKGLTGVTREMGCPKKEKEKDEKEEKISRWRDNLHKRKDRATQPMDHGRLR